jgi:hypothetical protein
LLAAGLLCAPVRALGQPQSPSQANEEPAQAAPVTLPAPVVATEPLVEPPSGRVEPLPAPQRVTHWRWELIAGGLGIVGVVWATDRLLARDLSPSPGAWFPVVGPWFIFAEQLNLPESNPAVLVPVFIDGVAQGAGLVLAGLGLILRKERLVLTLPDKKTTLRLLPAGGRPALSISF